MNNNITVIGCGISGMTTGICLLEAGYKVTIITEKFPHNTTSAKAAAIWFPYQIKPQNKANQWSLVTYTKFEELAQLEGSGVSMNPLIIYLEKGTEAWWKNALPKEKLKKLPPEELPVQYPEGYQAIVPLSETHIYLNYLLNHFKAIGGIIEPGKITDISKIAKKSFAVINCTGLGSRELMTDREMYPIYGQIVKIDKQEGIISTSIEYSVIDPPDEHVAYIISRSDCIVLGGTAIKNREDSSTEDQFTPGIIARCKQLAPKLSDVKIQSVVAGLRPGRTSVRLEREANIIHNYGHGGGGYTVSWGCAYEVLSLVKEI